MCERENSKREVAQVGGRVVARASRRPVRVLLLLCLGVCVWVCVRFTAAEGGGFRQVHEDSLAT